MHVNNEFKRARGEICVAFLNTVPALSKSGAKFGSAFGPVVFTPEIARARPGPGPGRDYLQRWAKFGPAFGSAFGPSVFTPRYSPGSARAIFWCNRGLKNVCWVECK